jgi:hypothetical protein
VSRSLRFMELQISDLDPAHFDPPVIMPYNLTVCAHFYNHEHRLRLETLYIQGFLGALTGFLTTAKPPCGGFRNETAVTWRFQKWKDYNFITAMCSSNPPSTDAGVRLGVTVM